MLASLVAVLLQSAAGPPPLQPHVVQTPGWERRPTPDEMKDLYPPQALKKRLAGKAVISCTLTVEGALADCRVVQEEPPGEGFGEAALNASRLFRMRPTFPDGRSVAGGTVRIPLRFGAQEVAGR